MENIRDDERVPLEAELRFRYPSDFLGRMKDFCQGGIGAELPVSVDIDSPVELEVFGGRLLISGHVRWLHIDQETVHVGIQFRESDRDLVLHIKDLKGFTN